jgi:hypothetical protein
MLLVMCVGGVGIPLVPVVQKDLSEPFPCQGCACACRDADSCWQHCCCHSDAEKLAWAAEHGVRPPAFVLARVRHAAQQQACSTTRPTASCCESTPQAPEQSGRDSDPPPEPTVRLVLLLAQSRCQGFTAWVSLMSTALLELHDDGWELHLPASESVKILTRRYESPRQQPPIPPPRVASRLLLTRPNAA